ncbi:MAG: hypothetical protein WBP61_14245 [Nocardioides sp.]
MGTVEADRVTGITRLLRVALVCVGLLVVFVVLAANRGSSAYAVTLAVVVVVLLASTGLALRALSVGADSARTWVIVTAVLLIVLAVPAVQVWVGLAMAITGVGLLFLLFSNDHERSRP